MPRQTESDTERFEDWLSQLGGKVRDITRRVHWLSAPQLEKELNHCEARLAELRSHAHQHSIAQGEFYYQFADIWGHLDTLRFHLEAKTRPWWARVLNAVTRVINLIATLLGVGPVLPLITGPRRPKSLPPEAG